MPSTGYYVVGHGQSDSIYTEAPVGDLLAARTVLARQSQEDPGRIALVGHSMGGRLTQQKLVTPTMSLGSQPAEAG